MNPTLELSPYSGGSYVYDVNNVYLMYRHTDADSGEKNAVHIVRPITFGSIEIIPSWQLLVNDNTSVINIRRFWNKRLLMEFD